MVCGPNAEVEWREGFVSGGNVLVEIGFCYVTLKNLTTLCDWCNVSSIKTWVYEYALTIGQANIPWTVRMAAKIGFASLNVSVERDSIACKNARFESLYCSLGSSLDIASNQWLSPFLFFVVDFACFEHLNHALRTRNFWEGARLLSHVTWWRDFRTAPPAWLRHGFSLPYCAGQLVLITLWNQSCKYAVLGSF